MFPCGDDLVCIIDDREDVWQGCGNLVQVKPYHFFRHTGNINAPPGLEKADASRPPEPANTNEPCTNDSQSKDDTSANESQSKSDAPEQLNEAKQSLDNPSVEETNHEENKDEKTEDEMEDTKNEKDEYTKATTEENAESNIQCNIAKEEDKEEEDKTDKEVTEAPSEKTDKDSKQVMPKQENNIIDEDDDDYLLYLEDILRRIHTEFYATLDQENTRKSLRDIIPRVRSQVLKGLCLTFSGLIPTHQKLHQSRAYKVARAFGAEVTQVMNLYFSYLCNILLNFYK